ncbi:MAG TPA: hypothetical protein VMY42_07435 [Thermoguttaceae bacterium]|nr:hypothetical protein [Thermoguttaceae bacterium]
MSGRREPSGCIRRRMCATFALGSLLLVVGGCSRAYYRHQADGEVYGLVDCANQQTGSSAEGFGIEPDPASRMFDPNNPDCPPMPPDDPTSHRLMRCVDGKRGWPGWDRYGRTRYVENPDWELYLPREENGAVVLDREGAVEMALLQSPEYQRALEELYLSALQVTLQRFQFDTQFFGGNSTFFTADGPDRGGAASSLLRTDTDLQMRKLFASGGELVVGMANSLVWQFAGPDTYSANTLLDFSLVQPLLRAGGRDVVLESLTDSERALLANVRQMERFRRGFYTQVVTGRSPGATPSRGGIGIVSPGGGAIGGAGGYFGLLEEQLRIRNRRANVAGLRESLQRLETLYEGGAIRAYQVGFTRQGLYRTQSTLLSEVAAYENRLDAYKINLGLPPQLDVRIEDSLLNRFELIRPEMTETQDAITEFLSGLRARTEAGRFELGEEEFGALNSLGRQIVTQLDVVEGDFETLLDVLPQRSRRLQQLSSREEFRNGDVDSRVADVKVLYQRVFELSAEKEGIDAAQTRAQWLFELCHESEGIEGAMELAELLVKSTFGLQGGLEKVRTATDLAGRLVEVCEKMAGREAAVELAERLKARLVELEEAEIIIDIGEAEDDADRRAEDRAGLEDALAKTLAEIEQFPQIVAQAAAQGDPTVETLHEDLIDLVDRLSGQALELSLIQAGARLDSIMLEPIEMTSEKALEIARENRRDWKNVRAALVDVWRQITVAAEDLESDLDVVFSGDIDTQDNNPVRFRGTTGRLRVGLEFDAPLTRLAERNTYRQTLINYHRTRREYYQFEDQIAEGLRDTIRTVRLNQLNFEVQRTAVFLAIDQVDEARLRLDDPRPTELGGNTGRDLVDALSGLLDAQNNFLGVWVNQEALRMNLDFDLGTMELDGRGLWVDPGPLDPTDGEDAFSEQPAMPGQDPMLWMPEEILTPAGSPLPEPVEAPMP